MSWRKALGELVKGRPVQQVWGDLARTDPTAAKAAAKINRAVYDAEKLVDAVVHGKVSKANTAEVAFMITADMKVKMAEAGFPKEVVSSMLPQHAHHVVKHDLSLDDYRAWLVEQQAAEAAAAAAADADVDAVAADAVASPPSAVTAHTAGEPVAEDGGVGGLATADTVTAAEARNDVAIVQVESTEKHAGDSMQDVCDGDKKPLP